MSETQFYIHNKPFKTELGETLNELKIAYTILGKINKKASNVVWICHAFTADANPEAWWPGMVGKDKLFSPDKYLIVCANILGSPYGSTSPLSINSETETPYFRDFPRLTVRDMVEAHLILAKYLTINQIYLMVGGSIGGFQAIEWAIIKPKMIHRLVLIATNAKTSPWRIAHNATQRMIIEADKSYYNNTLRGGINGMKAARAMALLSYRNAQAYNITQSENLSDKTKDFRADSYQRYQGEKFSKRFNAYCYYTLLNMLDTHDIGRKRGGQERALGRIKAKTLLVKIDSDILFWSEEMEFMDTYIFDSKLKTIHSDFGHDGFLLEHQQISALLNDFIMTD